MIEVICAADAVRFVPGKQHQHGASAATAMTRVAIDDHLAGKAVDWMEQVGDDELWADPRPSTRPKTTEEACPCTRPGW